MKSYAFIDASNIIYGAREIRKIAGKKHINFGGLRFLLERKKRGRP